VTGTSAKPVVRHAAGVEDRRMAVNLLHPADEAFAPAIAPWNLAITHTPDVAAAVRSTDDAVDAVRRAREQGLQISVQATGHGAHAPVDSGLLVVTQGLDEVRVDPETAEATIGAGAVWGQVVPVATTNGFLPIAGAASTVGVAGLLLGGGLGVFARSHGFASDRLVGATVVTGGGEVVDAADPAHADLLWALRGGKYGLGLVTEVRVRLVSMPALYGGSLFFAEDDIETALRAWADWTAGADEHVTTSAALINFPPFDAVPPPLRGRRLLSIRFAYPGRADEGERLAAPLRTFAPVYLDGISEMAPGDVARIHNDPTEPAPSWVYGMMLDRFDQDAASAFLRHAGPEAPWVAAELRHVGSAATRNDVEGGSAVGGRGAAYTCSLIGVRPDLFDKVLPVAADALADELGPWRSAQTNVNFLGATQRLGDAWSAETFARLAGVRERYDPDRVFRTPF
jgi:FAD binding domain-containing protein